MSPLPDGVSFLLLVREGSTITVAQEFIPDQANNYPESQAQEDANAAFQLLFAGHSGGTKGYHYLKVTEFAYEERPI